MGTIFDREYEPPEDEPVDAAYAVVHAAAGLVPGGAELLERIIAPPLAGRHLEWMREIAAAVRRLESERGITPEQLRDNPAFIDAMLTATQVAIRTSQAGKRRALRNAVLNSGLPTAPDITLQQVFLELTDRFTESHLAILQLFGDPAVWRSPAGLSIVLRGSGRVAADIVEQAFPELKGKRELYNLLWSGLHSAGLVNIATLFNAMEGDAVMKKRTTEMGDAFLAFITSPVSD